MIVKVTQVLSDPGGSIQKLFSKDSQKRVRIKPAKGDSFEANLGEPTSVKLARFGRREAREFPFFPLEDCEYENAGIICVTTRSAAAVGKGEPFRARLVIDGEERPNAVCVEFIGDNKS